jgi:Na+/phosphate symporter
MQKEEIHASLKYGQIIRRLQKLVDGHRDIVMRSHDHVDNHHSGLLNVQVQELRQVKELLIAVLTDVGRVISRRQPANARRIVEQNEKLRQLAGRCHQNQLERIRNGESKTRLTILYYSIIGNAMMLSKQNLKMLEIFEESFGQVEGIADFDLE